jgi:hypothetical protein
MYIRPSSESVSFKPLELIRSATLHKPSLSAACVIAVVVRASSLKPAAQGYRSCGSRATLTTVPIMSSQGNVTKSSKKSALTNPDDLSDVTSAIEITLYKRDSPSTRGCRSIRAVETDQEAHHANIFDVTSALRRFADSRVQR